MSKKSHNSFIKKCINYFFTGILTASPFILTVYIITFTVNFFDSKIGTILPVSIIIPGFGVLLACIGITIIGFFTATFLGKFFISIGEKILEKLPIIRSIYSTIKQIFETVFHKDKTTFKEVVLIQYPRKGIWSLGFITSRTKGEVQEKTKDNVVNVFLPTTPNPTSGFLLFLPEQDVVKINMSIEDGIKMVITAGIITPKRKEELTTQK